MPYSIPASPIVDFRKRKRTNHQIAASTHGLARIRAGRAELPRAARRAAACTLDIVRCCPAGVRARTSSAGTAPGRDMRQMSPFEHRITIKAMPPRVPHNTPSL